MNEPHIQKMGNRQRPEWCDANLTILVCDWCEQESCWLNCDTCNHGLARGAREIATPPQPRPLPNAQDEPE